MPKKSMTEAEKKAWGAKMKAAREAKQVPDQEVLNPDMVALQRQVEELKESLQALASQKTENAQVTSQGITGTREKYSTSENLYKDPKDRIKAEDRLKQFAFDLNFEIKYWQEVSRYQLQDGVWEKQPRFHIDLIGIKRTEDGEDVGDRYIIRRAVFHEDPEAAYAIAREKGLDILEGDKDFLDEMRYLRMRDWVFEWFYPPKVTASSATKEENIGNRLVKVYNINSLDPTPISFDKLG